MQAKKKRLTDLLNSKNSLTSWDFPDEFGSPTRFGKNPNL